MSFGPLAALLDLLGLASVRSVLDVAAEAEVMGRKEKETKVERESEKKIAPRSESPLHDPRWRLS